MAGARGSGRWGGRDVRPVSLSDDAFIRGILDLATAGLNSQGDLPFLRGRHMQIDHNERATRAWRLLVLRSRAGAEPFTYGELCALLGLHQRAAQYFLGVIQQYCRRNKLPALQSLAVNKKTRVPGKGYTGSERSRAAHKRELGRVRKQQWSLRAPNFNA